MAAPAFINAAAVHSDTTANASPITTDSYAVAASGRTLLVLVDHERGSTSEGSVLTIGSITRNGQAASRIKRHTFPGASANNEVGDVWQIQDADVGNYPIVITHTGTIGTDIIVIAAEYDGGVVDPDLAEAVYVGGAVGAPAQVDVDCPANSLLVIWQCCLSGGSTWGAPSHGTRRITHRTDTTTAGSSVALADYAVPAAGTLTGVHVGFTATSPWSMWGANLVIAFPLVAAEAPEARRPAQVMML